MLSIDLVVHLFGTELLLIQCVIPPPLSLQTPHHLLITQVNATFTNERMLIEIPTEFPVWTSSHRTVFQHSEGEVEPSKLLTHEVIHMIAYSVVS